MWRAGNALGGSRCGLLRVGFLVFVNRAKTSSRATLLCLALTAEKDRKYGVGREKASNDSLDRGRHVPGRTSHHRTPPQDESNMDWTPPQARRRTPLSCHGGQIGPPEHWTLAPSSTLRQRDYHWMRWLALLFVVGAWSLPSGIVVRFWPRRRKTPVQG